LKPEQSNSSITKVALGSAKLSKGRGLDEPGQIIGKLEGHRAGDECERQKRGHDQTPTPRSARTIEISHVGFCQVLLKPERLAISAGLGTAGDPRSKRIIQPIMLMPRHREIGTAGMGRRRHPGKIRARSAIPGIRRDLGHRYR